MQVKKSSKPKRASSEQGIPKLDLDPVFYREVVLSDLPSQYTEGIESWADFEYA